MSYSRSAINNKEILLIAIILVTAVFLIFRNFGLFPSVMDDEYAYSMFSRLEPLNVAGFPNYIYYAVYRATNVCGEGFLECTRIINVIFFVSATPFIYSIGSRIAGKNTAILISILSILAPSNVYTAFFMPESMYYFFFWAFTWFFFRTAQHQAIPQWALLGVLFGATSLVKLHAIFLLPALVCLFLVFFRQNENGNVINKLAPYIAFLASAIAIKFIVGYVLAGKSGLTVFGPIYSHDVSKAIFDPSHYLALTRLALENLRGHLQILFLLFSIPVAQVLLASKYFYQKPPGQSLSINLKLYTAAIFAVLLLVVTIFTASAIGIGPFETNARMHMRYYNFSIPLLLLVATSQLSQDSPVAELKWRAAAAFPVGAMILYAIYTKIMPYTPSFIDGPDFRGLTLDPRVFYFLGALSLISLLVWTFKQRLGTQIFVYGFLPLSVLSSTVLVGQELAKRQIPDVYDKAGSFAKQYLGDEKFPQILIVGSDLIGMYRAMFKLDNLTVSIQSINEIYMMANSEKAKERLAEKKWILLIGDYPLPKGTDFKLPMNGFTLAKVPGHNVVDFKKSSWPGVIANTSGLYPNEFWGTWSNGNVILEFVQPLPEKFAVQLWAYTYGSNVGKKFVAHVGKTSQSFTLGPTSSKPQWLQFDNPESKNTITIDIPSATSPKDLGLSSDDNRILGMAFIKMTISPLSVKW